MNAFKKLAWLTITPLFIIAMVQFIATKSFEDLVNTSINFFLFVYFSLIAACYVFIFEKRKTKGMKFFKNLLYSSGLLMLLVLAFSILFHSITHTNENFSHVFLISTFQSILALCIFSLYVYSFDLIEKSTQKEPLIFNEKISYYLKLILQITAISSALFLIFFIQDLYKNPIQKSLNGILKIVTSELLTSIVSFGVLYGICQIFKKSIILNVISATFLSFIIISGFWMLIYQSIPYFNINLFFTCLACCILFPWILIYRNKNQKIANLNFSFATKESEYFQLKNQVNPHFLFNNLNTLISFIEIEPKKAIEFGHHLSNVYRHYLKNEKDDFVPLKKELDFIKDYTSIFKAKFESGFTFGIKNSVNENQYILSLCLQELIDNIFKHNILDDNNPIEITISIEENYLVVRNSINKQSNVNSTKKGIQNINERYRILVSKEIQVQENANYFEVKIPILNIEK